MYTGIDGSESLAAAGTPVSPGQFQASSVEYQLSVLRRAAGRPLCSQDAVSFTY